MSEVPQQPFPMRLQKFLARAGAASRRRSEDLMTAGRVTVNGEVITELGSKVDPKVDVVCVDGIEIHLEDEPVYIMLYKPKGFLTTMDDPQGRPCVAQLVPKDDIPGLYPVGRLDKDTTGLLLFTSDGDMGQHVLHPTHHVEKTYLAHVEGIPSESQLANLRNGIQLDDGMTAPAKVSLIKMHDDGSSDLEIIIHEGRKRQVKRMCSAIHHPVIDLHRCQFGPLVLNDVEEGSWRYLTQEEIHNLRDVAGLL